MATLAAGPGFNSQQQQTHGTQGSGDTQLPKTKKGEFCFLSFLQPLLTTNVKPSVF
jgi:hypothetical protein